MTKNLEIEVKLRVDEYEPIIDRLVELGAVLASPRSYEYNVRYENAAGTLTEGGIVVRLRRDNRVRFTYKEPTEQVDDILRRFEAEVEVNDFDTMHLILERLGYTPHIIYEKYRTTYELDETEIVLDEMPYGNFIEIEGESSAIRRVLAKLGLQEAEQYNSNYIDLFHRVRHHLGLAFTDLTFENFAGVTVPVAAFQASE